MVQRELKAGLVGLAAAVTLTVFSGLGYQKPQFSLSGPTGIVPSGTPTSGSQGVLTASIVAKHNQPQDCWIIVNNDVYQVTDFLSLHPGGAGEIIPYCGQDATQAYLTKGGRGVSHSAAADQMLSQLKVGTLNGPLPAPTVINPQTINQLPQSVPERRNLFDD
ncbi:cytochrome b5 domain-containing protein [Patescibacteria group bacterium]|nr:cytochrome b5 domain-containing protein [Patescibacteria group bacterium]MCL5091267.1 cytochrome b5 domain-containing protein [Patescibacteria group bacterium]